MRLLLDTHVLLWWLAGSKTLSHGARRAIAEPRSPVFVSAASAWEIAIKRGLGKLRLDADLPAQLERNRFRPLAITIEHAIAAGDLPRHHDDPFDRMLVAQAIAEDLTIVTRDARIAPYNVSTLLA